MGKVTAIETPRYWCQPSQVSPTSASLSTEESRLDIHWNSTVRAIRSSLVSACAMAGHPYEGRDSARTDRMRAADFARFAIDRMYFEADSVRMVVTKDELC